MKKSVLLFCKRQSQLCAAANSLFVKEDLMGISIKISLRISTIMAYFLLSQTTGKAVSWWRKNPARKGLLQRDYNTSWTLLLSMGKPQSKQGLEIRVSCDLQCQEIDQNSSAIFYIWKQWQSSSFFVICPFQAIHNWTEETWTERFLFSGSANGKSPCATSSCKYLPSSNSRAA